LLRGRLGAGVRVVVDNDANVAAWGEYRQGAGRGSTHMILVTVGTGIGGGVVLGGELYRGARGMGAEIGHMSIDPQGPFCGCGQRGCWERLASGTALGRMAQEAVMGVTGSLILALAGGDSHRVSGRHVTEAASQGDELAIELIRRMGMDLGRGLVNLANIFDPDLFVIGGGLVSVGEPLLAPAREELGRNLEGASHRPEIPVVPAELGEKAGVVGAGLLVL
jgi:glucokinase